MNALYSEWNPKLMEIFSPEELIALDNLLMYVKFENNIAYQDSLYECVRDDKTDPEDLESIPGEDREIQEYSIFSKIHRKLMIYNEVNISDVPETLYTESKYSSNSSNQFRQAFGGDL